MSKLKHRFGIAAFLLAGALAVLDISAATAGGLAGGVVNGRAAAGSGMADHGAERVGGARDGSGDTTPGTRR